MWFKKFLNTIVDALPPKTPAASIERLADLNPDKFYVENVRSILNTTHKEALSLCEIAVRQGFFNRGIDIVCPDGSVAYSTLTEADLPETVTCSLLEGEDYVEYEFNTSELRQSTFYRLNDKNAAVLYR